MEEVIKYTLGIAALIAGYFLGILLRKMTLDEQVIGRKYFIALAIISALGIILGLIINKDWLIFTSAFFLLVTSRSLKQ